jgi:hypothetical protein
VADNEIDGSSWVDELLGELDAKKQQQDYDSDLARAAIVATPEMFRRLRDQVGKDCYRYNERRHGNLEFIPQEYGFIVRHSPFPSFELTASAQHGSSGTIPYTGHRKNSSSAHEEKIEGNITVIAKGQDQFYYRLDGTDYASERAVSRELLRNLLAALG